MSCLFISRYKHLESRLIRKNMIFVVIFWITLQFEVLPKENCTQLLLLWGNRSHTQFASCCVLMSWQWYIKRLSTPRSYQQRLWIWSRWNSSPDRQNGQPHACGLSVFVTFPNFYSESKTTSLAKLNAEVICVYWTSRRDLVHIWFLVWTLLIGTLGFGLRDDFVNACKRLVI